MNSSVFDILVYVFDRYMLEELPENPERETLARDLHSAGFGEQQIGRALDWLADLADERERVGSGGRERAFRIFSAEEQRRLDPASRGLLLALEHAGILGPAQRELVIERLLALDADELGPEQVKWVALMVLSSQPGQESACARMEDFVQSDPALVPH